MSCPALVVESRVSQIERWFDLSPKAQSAPPRYPIPPPQPGRLFLITGPSGSGKSRLLGRLRRRWRKLFSILNLDAIALPDRPMVDCLADLNLCDSLRQLCRVGLAEAHNWLLPPRHLSRGQRWRLKLAMALTYARSTDTPTLLVADEFAACLDRLSACIAAHTLRRQIQASNLRALIATSREDLLCALCPDRVIQCDFGTFS